MERRGCALSDAARPSPMQRGTKFHRKLGSPWDFFENSGEIVDGEAPSRNLLKLRLILNKENAS